MKKLNKARSIGIWRSEVRKKTSGYCRICGKQGSEAHHIFPKVHGKKLVVENGIFLCSSCHQFSHNKLGKAQKIIKSIIGVELWERLQER